MSNVVWGEKAMCEREGMKECKIKQRGREPKFKASSAGSWEIGWDCRATERNVDGRAIQVPLSSPLLSSCPPLEGQDWC